MKTLKTVDLVAFWITIAAGLAAAAAGGFGWTRTAVVAGCIAGIAPIVNRIATSRQHRTLIAQLGPRSLSSTQRQRLIKGLRTVPAFKLWVAHNRHEAEPSQFHKEIFDALTEADLEPQYFGGMTNRTIGIEISGARLLKRVV